MVGGVGDLFFGSSASDIASEGHGCCWVTGGTLSGVCPRCRRSVGLGRGWRDLSGLFDFGPPAFCGLRRVLGDTSAVGLRAEFCRGGLPAMSPVGWVGLGVAGFYLRFLPLGLLPFAGCVASWGHLCRWVTGRTLSGVLPAMSPVGWVGPESRVSSGLLPSAFCPLPSPFCGLRRVLGDTSAVGLRAEICRGFCP